MNGLKYPSFYLTFLTVYLTCCCEASGNSTRSIWTCNSTTETCTRYLVSDNTTEPEAYPNIEVCRLICGQYGALWPRPTKLVSLSKNVKLLNPRNIIFNTTGPPSTLPYLDKIRNIFFSNLENDANDCTLTTDSLLINIKVESSNTKLELTTDESYNLQIARDTSPIEVTISAFTLYGARHGLETLSQLTAQYQTKNDGKCLMINNGANISDKPIFKHRGLLLDTSRNFLTLDTIKRQLDGMAASKLNVLHWHVTDSHSFPLEIPSLPNMTLYGAYSNGMIYTKSDVEELFEYAKIRGIRILIEIDAPSHAGQGWQWAPGANLGNLSLCINQQPWRDFCVQPPCGQLNPVNSNVYKILGQIYQDILKYYYPQGEMFHMGGDEVFIPCWNSSEEILNYIKTPTLESFMGLWSEFHKKALKAFDDNVGNNETSVIIWSSDLTDPISIEQDLPKSRFIIQTWVPSNSSLPRDLLKLGYRLIISTKNAWYLDHGTWGKTEFYDWAKVYNNPMIMDPKVLGGEVCMWGELVDSAAIDERIWPRAAAAAERLWANPSSRAFVSAPRFYQHRERLVSRGIPAAAVTPRWCYLNDRQC